MHLANLRETRYKLLAPFIQPHLDQLKAHVNPAYHPVGPGGTCEPDFNPTSPDALATILCGKSDLYRTVAAQVTGSSIIDDPTRNTFKVVVLSMANSITPVGLAPRLGYGTDKIAVRKARDLMVSFWKAYPKVYSFLELMQWQVALTGQTFTWAGRTRTCSAHHWMTTLPRVEILMSYKNDSWYWCDIIPLRPGRHVLTCWVRKVWDATYSSSNYGKLIYEDVRGPLCTRPYKLLGAHTLKYVLPCRNIAWRSIRRVRTDSEEAQYFGFDTTARALTNFVFQAGTADVAKTMMLRAMRYCDWCGAVMLMNIHDELVFEVKAERMLQFIRTMLRLLELPPSSDWKIPIRVEAKHGFSFGDMRKLERPTILP